MHYLSPSEKRLRRARRLRLALVLLGAFVLVSLLDYPLLHLFYNAPEAHIEHNDWYRLLRVMGYYGTWVVVALIFSLHDRNRHRAVAMLLAPALSGVLAELLKLVVARERPVENGALQPGLYHFRGFMSGFGDGSNLGFPSSHAAVAFGGCLMLAYFIPRARTPLLLLAIGCGITRMLTGAHFASDVFVGALLGWGAASLMRSAASGYVPGLRPRYRLPG